MSLNHTKFILKYIESKANAWLPSTLRAEAYRLQSMKDVLNGDPETLWVHLEGHGAYSKVTYWTRAVQYWAWLMTEGKVSGKENPYSKWRQDNARRFSGAYQRKTPGVGLLEARDRVNRIANPQLRAKAQELLGSGMRFTESLTLANGGVVGKGGKRRKVYFDSSLSAQGVAHGAECVSYRALYDALKGVGLKPHDLRKIYAAELVKRGANPFQLCKVMGWSNLNTAQSYIEASDQEIEELLK